MVPVTALWLPILVAAVLVFVASSVIHMVLGYHNSDFAGVPDEESLRAAFRELNVPPGDYVVPHGPDAKTRRSEEFQAKMKAGPVLFLRVWGENALDMKSSLIQWFIYCILTGAIAAYATGIVYGPGADYMAIFRMGGTVAFAAYGWGTIQNSIWMKKNWAATGKSLFDAFVYGCLTAGALGWLWPG